MQLSPWGPALEKHRQVQAVEGVLVGSQVKAVAGSQVKAVEGVLAGSLAIIPLEESSGIARGPVPFRGSVAPTALWAAAKHRNPSSTSERGPPGFRFRLHLF